MSLYEGQLPAAENLLRDGLRLCDQHHIVVIRRLMLSELGYVFTLTGRAGEAVSMLEEAAELDSESPAMTRHALYLTWLGDAYLRLGRLAEAVAISERAIAISQRRKERGHEAWARRLRGHARAALADLQEALVLAHSLGMRPLSALIRLDLAALQHRQGESGPAQANLDAAQQMFTEMNMQHWLEAARHMRRRQGRTWR